MTLKNCRLVPEISDNVDFSLADIMISDGKIAAVRPASGAPAGEGDIDCAGRTVIPGLLDLHVHLVPEPERDSVDSAFRLYHRCAPTLGTFLDYGVTTVRDCGSTMRLACYLRDGVDKGLFEGPRILSSGHIISPEAMRGAEGGIHTIANGPDEVMKAARREFANGADFIKIYATQSMSQVRGQDPRCIFDPEEIAAMVAVAKGHNSYVAAHAHSTDAINACLRQGVRSIEHATYMDEESVRLLTTLPDAYAVLTHACSEPYHGEDGYNDPQELAFWTQPGMLESKKRCRAQENRAYQAGVRFGIGTDLHPGNFAKYPYEFRIRKEACGMADLDILIQATRLSADIALLGDVIGQVREGFAADLIAVDGKPDEDIHALCSKPFLVVKAGKAVRNWA